MARKKTPPAYGESDYCLVSMMDMELYHAIMAFHQWQAEWGYRNLGTGGKEKDKIKLTGPMIVACQWNYSKPS